MTIRNLQFMFKPASVALIGADGDPAVATLADNLVGAGFAGKLFAVGTDPDSAGISVYRKVSKLPQVADLAIIVKPLAAVPTLIAELGARGTRAVVVIGSGCCEVAEAKAEVEAIRQALLEAAKPHLLRIIGPGCLGILVPGIGLNASLAHLQPLPGQLAFIAQSGAMVTSMLDWANARGIGFSHLISLGTLVDVDFGDILDYLTSDPQTRAILLSMESLTHPRKFMSAARAAARVKPVIVVKTGCYEKGVEIPVDAIYDAMFNRAGMLRVKDMRDLFVTVETLDRTGPVSGDRLAVLCNGEGPGRLVADSVVEQGGCLAELSPATLDRLTKVLPRGCPPGNPVDMLADAPGGYYAEASEALLQDQGIDGIVVLNCPVALADRTGAAEAVIAAVEQNRLPTGKQPCLLTAWLGESTAQAARQRFAEHRVPTYETPTDAVHAFMTRVRYRRNQELLMQTPPAIPEAFAPDIESARQVVKTALADGHSWLAEIEAKALLAAYGVPVVTTQVAANPEEAAAIAAGLNRPVSLKIQAANIRHKSDVGGVALYLETPAVVRENARMMWKRIRTAYPTVQLLGFTVQPMIHRPHAHELSIEVISDPQFGPVIRFGQGGPAADVIADQVLALPPLNMLLAREMLSRTRVYRLLRGYRDMPAVDLDAIALTLVKISQLVIDLAEVDALEINPLLADEQGVLALGTRIKVTRAVEPAAQRLLIRPYPKELEETLTLPDGRRLQLRPVRPEDEPALHAAFAKLSPEEIFMRFFHHMKSLTHAAAARYTQIDYDREMALVLVSQPAAGETELYGVVRIVADPDRERAEFAIIVGMAMTGMGLGPLLMRRVIDYARSRGIKELFGEVLSENEAMLKLSRALGFSIRPMPGDAELMQVSLKL